MTTFNDDESARLHRLWVAHFRKTHREWDRYEVLNEMYDALDWRQRQLMPELQPPSLPFPEELRDMRCDARTRAGTPCKRRICGVRKVQAARGIQPDRGPNGASGNPPRTVSNPNGLHEELQKHTFSDLSQLVVFSIVLGFAKPEASR